jgi:transposase-like protein
MQVRNGELPVRASWRRTGKELSREARFRLAWMDFYRRTHNVARTCRHFGISRQTFYRWLHRYLVCRPRRSRPRLTAALSALGQ